MNQRRAALDEQPETLPFLPYGRQCIEDDDIAAVVEVLRGDWLTTGPNVAAFEQALAERVGARFAVAVSSGTMALHAAYFAAGLGPRDAVVVPAITFVATANAALYVGAEPRFADVDPYTGLITPDTFAKSVAGVPSAAGAVRAVVPVHLNGMPVELEPLANVARAAGVTVIEDAAHALGATYRGQPIGCCQHSAMAVFSFHPVKHVTTGEGGAVVTNDEELYARLKAFRTHGMVYDPARFEFESPGPWYHEQQFLGHNGRLTDIQCALGSSQLKKLDRFVARRRALAARYDELVSGLEGVVPVPGRTSDAESSYHLYAVLIDFERLDVSRAELMQRLRSAGIGSQVHYMPVPSQPFYRRRATDPSVYTSAYTGANRYYSRALSLPLFPTMADSDVDRVVAALRQSLFG